MGGGHPRGRLRLLAGSPPQYFRSSRKSANSCRGSQGQIAPASRTAEIVSSLDLLPTASALAGVALPTDRVCKLTTAMHALLVVLFALFFQHVRKLTRRALPFR